MQQRVGHQTTTGRGPPSSCSGALFISILGGPGSGKGTVGRWLQDRFNFEHISMGDIMRAEMHRAGSPHADLIRECMREGTLGPKEIGIGLLKARVARDIDHGTTVFVLDGTWPTEPTHECGAFP